MSNLLQTGKHIVTALTRTESKGTLPEGIERAVVNYDDQDSLVTALRGQDFLIVTLAVRVPPDTHSKIVRAASIAGVPWVMPNWYGSDIRNKATTAEPFGAIVRQQLAEVEGLPGLSYISLACGTWYEWSLALGDAWFGFSIPDRKATFYDDGNTPVNVSTWPLCGHAIAALLSLPESGTSPALSDWKDGVVYLRSFEVSQRNILDSLHRVLGTSDTDWTISYQSAAQRAEDGLEEYGRGVNTGIAKNMYAKLFLRSAAGDLEYSGALDNEKLGLSEENLDEATKRAVDMVESGWNPLTG